MLQEKFYLLICPLSLTMKKKDMFLRDKKKLMLKKELNKKKKRWKKRKWKKMTKKNNLT